MLWLCVRATSLISPLLSSSVMAARARLPLICRRHTPRGGGGARCVCVRRGGGAGARGARARAAPPCPAHPQPVGQHRGGDHLVLGHLGDELVVRGLGGVRGGALAHGLASYSSRCRRPPAPARPRAARTLSNSTMLFTFSLSLPLDHFCVRAWAGRGQRRCGRRASPPRAITPAPRTFFLPLLELAAARALASLDFCSLGACVGRGGRMAAPARPACAAQAAPPRAPWCVRGAWHHALARRAQGKEARAGAAHRTNGPAPPPARTDSTHTTPPPHPCTAPRRCVCGPHGGRRRGGRPAAALPQLCCRAGAGREGGSSRR